MAPYRKIVSKDDVSLATVSRVIKLKQNNGAVSPKTKGKCGRKRKTTKRDDATLPRLSKTDPRKLSDALNIDLKEIPILIYCFASV